MNRVEMMRELGGDHDDEPTPPKGDHGMTILVLVMASIIGGLIAGIGYAFVGSL